MSVLQKCVACRTVLPPSGFYRNGATKNGLSRECRVCSQLRARARRAANPDRILAINRAYRQRYPERARARSMVSTAIVRGKILRPAHCFSCRKPRPVEAHHENYDKPFEITWLCRACHWDHHASMRRAAVPTGGRP